MALPRVVALCSENNTTSATLTRLALKRASTPHGPDGIKDLVTVAKRGGTTAYLRDSPAARRFGADIKQVRVARRLTQRQLAQHTGYSETYVSRVEAGRWLPSEEFTKACDKVFGTGHLFADQPRSSRTVVVPTMTKNSSRNAWTCTTC